MALDVPPTPIDDIPSGSISDDPVVQEAIKRFRRCEEWESIARDRFLEDLKFANGDSLNGFQWPNSIRFQRDSEAKPCLTMNIVKQHNLQIINSGKQVKIGLGVVATGNGATKEAADVFTAVMQNIEYQSSAESCYSMAREFQVDGGIGWWRIVTGYAPGDTFDLDIFISPVPDPLSIFIDPDCRQRDKSDARFGFVFDMVPRDEFEVAYPELKGMLADSPLGSYLSDDSWMSENHIRVCEYFRLVPKQDSLISFVHKGERKSIRASAISSTHMKKLVSDPLTRVREIQDTVCEWYLIAGETVIDSTIWPGKYIPLIPCIGQETIIDGILDRKGHTRIMADAQR